MNCENGHDMPLGAKFCPVCGAGPASVVSAPPTEPMLVAGTAPIAAERPWYKRKRFIIPGVLLALLIVAAIAGGGDTDDKTPAAAARTTTTRRTTATEKKTTTTVKRTTTSTAPTTTTTTEPPVPSFGDGKHRVGEDVQPGIYRIADVDSGCYWARLKGLGGGFDDIIANDNATGSAVVSILASDEGFESNDCGTWKMDTSRITDSMTEFGEGTFITATDFEPGQYRNSGGSGCYWQRLKNFEGGFGSIIANDNADGQTIVEIAASDAGFDSADCGTWTKL